MWRTLFLVPKMPRSSAERQLRVTLLAGDVPFPREPAAVGVSALGEAFDITRSAPLILGYEVPRQGGCSPDYQLITASVSAFLDCLQRVIKS